MFRELAALEDQHPDLITPDSPTQAIGGSATITFSSVEHRVPMMSLDNAFAADDVEVFAVRVRRFLNLDGDAGGHVGWARRSSG